MAKLGGRRESRLLWWIAGALAVIFIAASFGTPKAGCAGAAEDSDQAEVEGNALVRERPGDDDVADADVGFQRAAVKGPTERVDAQADVDADAEADAGSAEAAAIEDAVAANTVAEESVAAETIATGAAPDPSSVASLLAGIEHAPSAPDGATFMQLLPIPRSTFCATAGRVTSAGGEALNVATGGMRGVVASDSSRAVEVAFVFRGNSVDTARLANGELRQQIGVKLRAQDTCNIVYVMWHIAPTPRLAVSVKNNPGKRTHAECLDQGYINLRPSAPITVPVVAVGEPHTLRAEIDGDRLIVHADGVEVWRDTLPPQAFTFDGAAGIRTDNSEFDFQLRLPGGGNSLAQCQNAGTELAH